MPRILIAGCGYVGQATADLFHRAGWKVEGWTRSSAGTTKAYPVHAIDLTDAKQVHACKANFDAIVHCASTRGGDVDLYRGVYLNGARNLLETFVTSTIVFTSSTSVYSQSNGEWVTEESETKPARKTSRILLETENLVLAYGGIVTRLAGIYGPGRSALLSKFLTGEAIIDLEDDRFINQVHRDDIAAALFLLLDRQLQGNQIYNVVDDQPIRQRECYRWLAGGLNRPLPPVGKSTLHGKRGESNKRVSNAKLRRLGWIPRYPTFAEAMEKSILPSLS
jgi:nucleoside-diphosphate-sugar epimerase